LILSLASFALIVARKRKQGLGLRVAYGMDHDLEPIADFDRLAFENAP